MQTETKDTPRLVKWANDNYPPIDLIKEYKLVRELIDSYKELKEENEILKYNLRICLEALNTISKDAFHQNTSMGLGRLSNTAKEAINKCK